MTLETHEITDKNQIILISLLFFIKTIFLFIPNILVKKMSILLNEFLINFIQILVFLT